MAKDVFHHQVKNALIKDGWTITDYPLTIRISQAIKVQIDLAAENAIAAERNTEKIAVEIKSFIADSYISEFHTALGQYLNYVQALEEHEPERIVYLAVPNGEHPNFAKIKFVVGASRSLLLASEQDARTTKKSIYTFGMLPPNETYQDFFQLTFIQRTLKRYQIKLIVYEPKQEKILLWIK